MPIEMALRLTCFSLAQNSWWLLILMTFCAVMAFKFGEFDGAMQARANAKPPVVKMQDIAIYGFKGTIGS
jgi:hypothetical protein